MEVGRRLHYRLVTFGKVDGILRTQAKANVGYFAPNCGRAVKADEMRHIEAAFLAAYRCR